MANMLSAQLATMTLNVRHSKVSGGAIVYAGCGNTGLNSQFITITDLMAAADASLHDHPLTTTAGADRTYQECLKTALDNANNNTNFVQPSPTQCGTPRFPAN